MQNDGSNGAAIPPVPPGPVLSFGLNVGGYSELDMPLDGVAGRPTVAELTDGNPHHIVATYDSVTGVKALYVDGNLRFSTNLGAGSLITSGGASLAIIGNTSLVGFEPFTGLIDEVAIYDGALPASTINFHFTCVGLGQSYFAHQPPAVVPTLSEWGALGVALLLGLLAVARLQRQPGLTATASRPRS